jgi:hypothetical protein
MTRRVLCGLVPLLVFTLVGNAAAQQTCTQPPPGLVSWWPGNGNANDIADSNNGMVQGDATFVPGQVSQAFRFDGVDDFVRVANSPALEPTTITVDAWVKSTAPGTFRYILSKGASACDASSYALYTGSSGGLFFYVFNGSTFFLSQDAGTGVWDGNWHHVAGTFDGSTVRLYVDGAEVVPGTPANINIGYNLLTTNDLFIGRFNGTCPPELSFLSFRGDVDEVEIYNRALDPSEIQAIFMADSAGKCINCVPAPSGLVSWWPFDETSGTSAADIQDGNPGTLIGGSTFTSGLVGNALSFAGVNGYVEIVNAPNLNFGTGSFTVDAWVNYPNPFTDLEYIADHGASNAVSPSEAGWHVAMRGGQIEFDLRDQTGQVPGRPRGFAPAPAGGVWHHVALVVDRANNLATLFVDGASAASAALPSGFGSMDNNGNPAIGATNRGGAATGGEPGGFFKGLIDEVEIYNRALTAEEIADIVHADRAGKCKVIEVSIDIKPGSFPNSIKLSSKGVIPVAILTTDTFDATTVDPTTVCFGDAEEPAQRDCTEAHTTGHIEDVDGDGDLDLVLHYETGQTGIDLGDTQACLTGMTFSGQDIQGCDSVRTL